MDELRIVVGFKVTPDYEALRPGDWARAAADDVAVRADASRYVRRVLNVFDEAALELSLRLRDTRAGLGLETSLAAFTVAGREADPFLRTLQALGFECARIEAGADLGFAPAATAALVAAGAEQLGGDFLLLGSRSGPGDSGAVPVLTAEALGLPCLTQVSALDAADDQRLRVTFATDAGPVRASVAPPCVLAIGNALVSVLRAPTLKERMVRKDDAIAVLSGPDLGIDVAGLLADEPGTLTGLEVVDRDRAGVLVRGATPAEKARRLYDQYLRSQLERG